MEEYEVSYKRLKPEVIKTLWEQSLTEALAEEMASNSIVDQWRKQVIADRTEAVMEKIRADSVNTANTVLKW